MVFDGEMTLWPKETPLPSSQSYSLMLRNVLVQTEDAKVSFSTISSITESSRSLLRDRT